MAYIMESTSEPMKIQISEATQGLLDDDKPQHHRRSSITVHCKRPKFITKKRETVCFLNTLLEHPILRKIFYLSCEL